MTTLALYNGENDPVNGSYEELLGVATCEAALFEHVKELCAEDHAEFSEPEREVMRDGMAKYTWNELNLFAYEVELWDVLS